MKPDDVIADLVQSHGGPCVLDKLHLPYDRASAGPAAKFGLGCDLYLSDTDRSKLREQALQYLLDFQQMFPEQVHEFLPRDSRRTVKFTDDLEARVRADYAKYPVETGYGAGLFGAVDIGLPKDDIQPYQASVVVRRAQYEELSYFSAYTPVCGDRGHPNFDTLLAAVLRWSAICRPMHGSAGFALIFASGMSQNTKYALHLMKRFPGFHYVHGVDFALEAGNAHNRIKCINWLTILGDELVAELGGVDPMRAALEPVCKVHEYPGGIVIQAGEVPQLGDTYRNNVPEAYRIVARYTKALRFENYSPDGLFRVPGNLDDAEEALSWIRRFD